MLKNSYLYASVAIFCWSTVATTSKILLNELNNFQVLWINSLIAFVFSLLVNIFTGTFEKEKSLTLKDCSLMILIGLLGTFFYYAFYYNGTDILPASQAFIINYLWPILTLLFSCLILKEKLTFKKFISILISFIGVFIVIGANIGNMDSRTLFGALCCILGAVSYALFSALNKKNNYNKSIILMLSYFVTFIITTIINAVNGDVFFPQLNQVPAFLWNGIFSGTIANMFWLLALKTGKTERISNLAYITPFLSSIWTAIFLKEKITVNLILGLVVIVLGIVIQLTDKSQSTKQS